MIDLFTPVVPEHRQHPNFSEILRATPEDRAVLSNWAEGFIDRDGKFAIEFQTTFNSSFWELYLYACLKERKQSVDFGFEAPDFVVLGPDAEFCVEASIANSAQGAAPEWSATVEALIALENRSPIVNEATIRLANTVASKHDKFEKRYHELPQVAGKPFVLAVAPFEQPHFSVQNAQAIRRVLYGYDGTPFKLVPGQEPGTYVLEGGELYSFNTIKKASGADIPLGYFQDDRMKGISAVLFSSTATWSKVRALSADPNANVWFEFLRFNDYGPEPIHGVLPKEKYREPLMDGLYVLHNPHADYPLPWEIFRSVGVTQEGWELSTGDPIVEAVHGSLLQRRAITMRVRD